MDDEMLLDDPEMTSDEGEELGPDGLPIKSKPILGDEEDGEDEEPETDESLM